MTTEQLYIAANQCALVNRSTPDKEVKRMFKHYQRLLKLDNEISVDAAIKSYQNRN